MKKITRPLRFSIQAADAMQEQKPAVRISQQAVNDLIDSWIVKKYGLVMNNKKDISGT
ncbi:hypothetical protein ACXZ7E_29525 [Paenibacillus lautus]